MDTNFDDVIEYYQSDEVQRLLNLFIKNVEDFFRTNTTLNRSNIIHSVKSRHKDPEHLRDKLKRKSEKNVIITKETLLSQVTDLNGVRILHLYLDQFPKIHSEIMRQINDLDEWKLVEQPKAYSWDPECQEFFKNLGIEPEIKATNYTSVHYVVKPNNEKNLICCEIQVRTLFEEIWGEIDHAINYPHEIESIACKEQIRVLAKLVSTGTRLADSIFRTYNEYTENQ